MKIDPQIKKDLKERLKMDLEAKKQEVTVVSAYKLDVTEAKNLLNRFPSLKGSKVKYEIDSAIIAGYIVKIGSKVIDMSVSGQLQSFKKIIYELD